MEDFKLSADALSSLTSRIQNELKPTGQPQVTKPKPAKINAVPQPQAKSGQNGKKCQKKPKTANTAAKEQPKVNGKLPSNPAIAPQLSKKTNLDANGAKKADIAPTKGKKRTRDGQVKVVAAGAVQVPQKMGKHLHEEVLALGGTEEDIDLVENAGSESEIEGSNAKFDKKLSKELQKMVQELGITKASADSGDTSDEFPDENEAIEDYVMEGIVDLANPNEIVLQPRKKAAVDKSSPVPTFEPRSEWHSAPLPPISSFSTGTSLRSGTVESLHEYAKELLEKEAELYASMNKSKTSAHQFYSTIMASGTLSDRISALTLSVQESPLHNKRGLETLVGLAKKRSRGQAIEVLTALKDLLGPGSLLPSDRRLTAFSMQPGLSAVKAKDMKTWNPSLALPSPLTRLHLLSWAYEDWLKSTYFEILKIVETWCNDEIVFARTKALDIVFELLRDKPEQEANLLRLLVNKLGDTEKKIASRASYNILQLQIPHPLMKPTIISAIESDVLFRPGQSMHAKYYAIITLNQTVLSSKEDAVARKVLELYFSLFLSLLSKPEAARPEPEKKAVNKKGERQGGGGKPGKMALKKQTPHFKGISPEEEIRERMMSAVLTGINRALPFTDTTDDFLAKHLDTLFRVTHSSNFNTSVQALMLIQQLCGTQQAASDRFYRTLYESLLDPRLLTTSKQILYLNLLYKALRADLDIKRVKAFAKRLLQVIAMHQPAFACAVLYLLRELEGIFPNLSAFIDQAEEDPSEEEEEYHDVPENDAMSAVTSLSAKQPNPNAVKYDGRKRAPEYSNAEKSCLWELATFGDHFHPSVSLFATRLLEHEPMPPKPSLDSHNLIHFLDRFVYRNPKNVGKMHGSSIMQPIIGGDTSGLLVARGTGEKVVVNSDVFYKMQGENVDADDVFFHKYFNAKAQGKESAKQKKEKKRAAHADSEEDDDEAEIWQALVDSRPELEGSDSDGDVDMDDFSELEYSGMEDAVDGEMESLEADKDHFSEGDSEGLDFDDDDGVLLDSDEEVPIDLEEAFEKEVQAASMLKSSEEETKGQDGKEKRGEKRRRLKNLPIFASADDYVAMLDAGDESDQ